MREELSTSVRGLVGEIPRGFSEIGAFGNGYRQDCQRGKAGAKGRTAKRGLVPVIGADPFAAKGRVLFCQSEAAVCVLRSGRTLLLMHFYISSFHVVSSFGGCHRSRFESRALSVHLAICTLAAWRTQPADVHFLGVGRGNNAFC